LFRYTGALERGDFQTVAGVLREAERDPALAAMMRDLDEALAAELPVLKASSNHHHPSGRVDVVVTPSANRTMRLRPVYPFTLAAAVLVVALFAGLLLFNRPNNPIEEPTSAAVAQGATVTPSTTYTPEPSSTRPLPINTTPTHVQAQIVLCEGLVNRGDGANLFIAPDANAQLITRLPSGATLQIINQEVSIREGMGGIFWMQVNAQISSGSLVGWLDGESVALLTTCPVINMDMTGMMPTPQSPVFINAEDGPEYILRATVGNIVAGSPVQILGGYYDGQTWLYEVQAGDGWLEMAALEQLLEVISGESVNVMGICLMTSGSSGTNLYLAPDYASPVLVPIEARSELVGTVITSVDMPGGEGWLLVGLESTPPAEGWLNRADLLNGELACTIAPVDMMPIMPFGAAPIEAQPLWPTALPPVIDAPYIVFTATPPLPEAALSTATPEPTITPTHTFTPTFTATPIP
jgi:hypothetical protein